MFSYFLRASSGAKSRYSSRIKVVGGRLDGRKWMSLRFLYISIVLSGEDVWCRSARERRAPAWWSMGILCSIENPGSTGDVIRDNVSDIWWMCCVVMVNLSVLWRYRRKTTECWFRGTVSLRGRSHLPSRRGPFIVGSDFLESGFFLLSGMLTAFPLKFVQVIDFGGIVNTCSILISF